MSDPCPRDWSLCHRGYCQREQKCADREASAPASAPQASQPPHGAEALRLAREALCWMGEGGSRNDMVKLAEAAVDAALAASPLPAPQEPAMTEAQALVIADKYGQRWKASDEEGISFEKSHFFMFLSALLTASLYAAPAPDSTP